MDIPATVKGYELLNQDKVRRALEGNPTQKGNIGGIALPDGTYDDFALLAEYDKLGGGIKNANGDSVKSGSFYNYGAKAPRLEPNVILTFRINGQVVEVPEKEEAPAIVKAAQTLAKQVAESVKPKAKKAK